MTPAKPTPKHMRAWVWHPRKDVGPKLVPVLRVLKTGTVIILDEPSGKEYGIPTEWLNVPPDAEGVE